MVNKIIILLMTLNLTFAAVIVGKVYDSTSGTPLIGANVYLEDTNLGGTCDANGQYIITDIEKGQTYSINVRYIGYKKYSQDIIVNTEKFSFDIMLEPTKIKVKGAEIVGRVKAIKDKITNSPATKELISAERIEVESSTNLGSYLKGLKGVDYTASGMDSYSISVRGFNSSFSSRLLTLTDGRVANIPALRVVSYNTIPQSQDDIEKMEVILGPATALYGANAHSGVVNIVSKSPSVSEGLTMHVSGTSDERELRKINGRFAKKINDYISFKVSGSYLHAYEWEFISEDEWKNHQFAWIGSPDRTVDKKDNNPWSLAPWTNDDSIVSQEQRNEIILSSSQCWNINEYWIDENNDGIYQIDEFQGSDEQQASWDTNIKYVLSDEGHPILIGNGEANHISWDDDNGDGVIDENDIAGEDWVNGYDDDGDGRIDEDYFEADGIDNDGDCPGDTNGDGIVCGAGDLGVDENIDDEYDLSYDGMDNNGNGQVDESWEFDHNGSGISNWGSAMDSDSKIIIFNGRKENQINGIENPWHTVNGEITTDNHIRGDYTWDETNFTILFDIYTEDFGDDGIPGDYFEDSWGNELFEPGEYLTINNTTDEEDSWLNNGHQDVGLDGIPNTYDEGEGDGIWQPGDGWVDINNNGIIDVNDAHDPSYCADTNQNGICDNTEDQQNYTFPIENPEDLWPLLNGTWDIGETFEDCGTDGLCPGDDGYPGPDLNGSEGNGAIPIDLNEGDGNYDTGDGCYGCDSDEAEILSRFEQISDNNGDTLNDYPDFEIDNRKVETRIDIKGIPFWGLDNVSASIQSGYSWSKSQVVTGVGRYLLDGWEYTFNQLKLNYKNWFFQTYLNKSYSGNTRGYLRGDRIVDLSQNRAYQIQNNFNLKPLETEVIWGIDYFKTQPVTNGTILNDGPNERDEDGDGQVDEVDEFDDVIADEIGLYFQTSSKLTNLISEKWELITAARLDYHDQLKEEGLQFGPKFGLMYDPSPKESWRLTFGRAFNTPTTTQLFTNYFVQSYRIFDVYLRGNKEGTEYVRVDENTNVVQPVYYDANGEQRTYGTYDFEVDTNNDGIISFNGDTNGDGIVDEYDQYDTPYIDRIQDMPYFFLYQPFEGVPTDWIPLDTSNFLVYIPEPNGDGYIIRPGDVKAGERYMPDIPAIKSEKINSFELGYKRFIEPGGLISIDYYVNHYSDFFSPATYITPTVIYRYPNGDINGDGILDEMDESTVDNIKFAGFIPGNQNGSNPPYGTGWNGLDDDGDWEVWASDFGWDTDDTNNDGDPRDPGEWGFVDLSTGETYTPAQLGFNGQNINVRYLNSANNDYEINANELDKVGIDEWTPEQGMAEFECESYPCSGNNAQGRPTSPPEIILGVLNYGNVWTQGVDVAFSQATSEKMFWNGNFSWYNTTEFYNELTKRNDPINAPKFKWNINFNYKDEKIGMLSIGYRHVDQFEWQDGIWAGQIGPYDLFDLHYKYQITQNLSASLSCLNIFNDVHREIIGGAKMGRQIVMRFSTEFK